MISAATPRFDRCAPTYRSPRPARILHLASFALFAWLLGGPRAAFAQEGAITGTVTDSETLRPVPGAQVFVAGTVIGTLTGEGGTYRLGPVPAGEATVTVRLIGYKEASQTVNVEAGQVATADFAVEQTALRLQDIVVTGVVGETPRVKLPFTVERLDSEDLPVPSSNVASLLAAKAPGVMVISGSGQPGQAAEILLRGPTSIDATGRTQAPLIVVDGVIQSESATLADIGALDVDHIEIVKGAAAASLYGSRAQNGVIQVTTKRGTDLQTNTFQFMARGEYGVSSLAGRVELSQFHPFLLNESGTKFIDSGGNEVDYAGLGQNGPVLADGGTEDTAFQDNPYPGPVFDQLDRFFDPGETISGYGAVTGRFGESAFRVSFEHFLEEGVVACDVCEENLVRLNQERVSRGLEPHDADVPEDEGYERQNARINVDTRFGDIDIAASAFYSRSEQDDSAVQSGAFGSLLGTNPPLDLTELDPTDGYPRIDPDPLGPATNPLYSLAILTAVDKRTRTMGSLDARWSPVDWISIEANASYDRTDFDSFEMLPKIHKTRQSGGVVPTLGRLGRSNFVDEATNASVTAGINRRFMDGDLTLRAKARYVVEDQSFDSNGVIGNNFSVEGVPTFGAIEGDVEGSRTVRGIKAQGYFGIASADYQGKYIVDGLVRRDGSSLFGPRERWHTYFRGSAAWRVAQEEWWDVEAIDELKLRFSYGTAGGRPNFFAQYETYAVGGGAVFPIHLGNRALKPEFTTEREAGVNLVLFDDFGIDYTYAWADTEDQLLLVPQPAFVGFTAQWQNAGTIESQTHELSLRWAAIDETDVGLNFRLNWDRTSQRITRLDVPPYRIVEFFVAPGRPLGEIWGTKWAESCADLAPRGISAGECSSDFAVNSDGLLVWTGGAGVDQGIAQGLWGTTGDVNGESFEWGIPIRTFDRSPVCLAQLEPGETAEEECALQERLPLGSTTPDWNASFHTNFRYRGFSLAALLDASVGFEVLNQSRITGGVSVDQIGVPEPEKKPLRYYGIFGNVGRANTFLLERGDWLKVRELSVGYTLPETFTRNLLGGSFDRITLSLIGRNLLTITDYTGYDPEVGFSGGDFGATALNRVDFSGYPNFRTVTAALEVIF